MADQDVSIQAVSVQAENNTETLPLDQPPQDQARIIPFGGPFTERERTNVIVVNEVWDVAHDLERTQGDIEEYAQMLEEGRFVQETLHMVRYLVRRLPSICEDNRDRLMKAAQLMAEANGVRFVESTGRGVLAGKDGYMCVQSSFARGTAQVEGGVAHE